MLGCLFYSFRRLFLCGVGGLGFANKNPPTKQTPLVVFILRYFLLGVVVLGGGLCCWCFLNHFTVLVSIVN